MNNTKNNSSLLAPNELSLPFKKLVLEAEEDNMDNLEFLCESAPMNDLEFFDEAGPSGVFEDGPSGTGSDLIVPVSSTALDFGNGATIKKNT